MANQIIPNATSAEVQDAILALGEAVWDRTLKALRVGDGITPGGLVIAGTDVMAALIAAQLQPLVAAAETASAGASAAQGAAEDAAAETATALPVLESLDPDVLARANAIDPNGRLVAQFPDPATQQMQREAYRGAVVESLDPQVTTALLLLDGVGKIAIATPPRVTLDVLGPVAARAPNLTAATIVETLDPTLLSTAIVVDAAGKQLGGTVVGLPTPIDQMAGQLVTAAGRTDSLVTRLSRGLTPYGDPLDPVYGRWFLRETHMRMRKRKLGEPVQLIAAFIGDSYTAGLYWVPAAAKTLQDARGLAGLGWVGFSWWGDPSPTVAPAVALRIDGSARPDLIPAPTVTSGWRASYANANNPTPSTGIITATVAGERVTVVVPAGHTAAQLHHKGGGDIRYSWDGGVTWRETITLGGATAANVALSGVPAGNASLVIETVSGTVALAGVDLQSSAPGVRVHKLGASGSATTSWAGVNAAAWRAGLQALAPHLVVIGFLTNDQGAALIPETTFATNLATIVANVRAALPYADILITAPPENQRTNNVYPMWRYARAARELAVSLGCTFLDHQYNFGAVPSDYAAANPARSWYHSDLVHPATDTGGRAIADANVSLIDPSL